MEFGCLLFIAFSEVMHGHQEIVQRNTILNMFARNRSARL
jgi:hypothetical protein